MGAITYGSIIGIDTCGRLVDATVVVLADDDGVGVNGAVDDLEAGLVCDALAVAECGRFRLFIARHGLPNL